MENGEKFELDKNLTEELREEGFARELIRVIQSARKKAGLNVDDRIKLFVGFEIPEKFLEMIKGEVLAKEIVKTGNFEYDEIVKVEGKQGTISLEKA